MKVMILAAGLGTRLQPLTHTCPKPLVPLMLEPMLGRLLAQLRQYHVQEVVINLHHQADQIRQWVGDGRQWGFERVHVSYEPEILGTAGAIKKVEAVLRDAPFWMINADVLTDVDLAAVWQWHRQRRALVTMVLRPDPDAHRYGPVVVDGDSRVCHINGQPETKTHLTGEAMMFTGLQVVSPQIFADIPPAQYISTTMGTYPMLIDRGAAVCGYRHEGYWMDIGVPQRYRQAHWDLLDGVLEGPPLVPAGTWIIRRTEDIPADLAHVTIIPPVVVGPDVKLTPKTSIGPYVVMGTGCRLEPGAGVRESILWDDVRVGANARVDRCVFATGVVVKENQVVSDAMLNTASEIDG